MQRFPNPKRPSHSTPETTEKKLRQSRILLPPLLSNLLLTEPPRLAPQHLHPLLQRHVHLFPYGHQRLSQALVVLGQDGEGDHEVVDVVEDEGMLVGVLLLLLKEGGGVVAPVAERVEVMRGVVAVVVTVAVALGRVSSGIGRFISVGGLTAASIKVMLDRKSESGCVSSTKACWPQFPTISAMRMNMIGSRYTKVVARPFSFNMRYTKM